jgi:hypothetical protein
VVIKHAAQVMLCHATALWHAELLLLLLANYCCRVNKDHAADRLLVEHIFVTAHTLCYLPLCYLPESDLD